MINTKSLVKLNKFKTKVDELIYNSGVSFTSHLSEEDPDHPGYAYVVNGVGIGLIYAVNNKFSGLVAKNLQKCSHMEKEGFCAEVINEEVKWSMKTTAKAFVELLIRQ